MKTFQNGAVPATQQSHVSQPDKDDATSKPDAFRLIEGGIIYFGLAVFALLTLHFIYRVFFARR